MDFFSAGLFEVAKSGLLGVRFQNGIFISRSNPKQPWTRIFPLADMKALDLLDKMLAFNPDK